MAQRKEPAVKRVTKNMNVRFRPRASLAFPDKGTVTIVTSGNTLNTQAVRTMDALKEEDISGKATATALPLMLSASIAMATTAKTKYLATDVNYTT